MLLGYFTQVKVFRGSAVFPPFNRELETGKVLSAPHPCNPLHSPREIRKVDHEVVHSVIPQSGVDGTRLRRVPTVHVDEHAC